jgi:hypothetical protein
MDVPPRKIPTWKIYALILAFLGALAGSFVL